MFDLGIAAQYTSRYQLFLHLLDLGEYWFIVLVLLIVLLMSANIWLKLAGFWLFCLLLFIGLMLVDDRDFRGWCRDKLVNHFKKR